MIALVYWILEAASVESNYQLGWQKMEPVLEVILLVPALLLLVAV